MTTFTDDFNRADSTNLGANWVEVSGDWSIISNQLSSGSAGGTIILRAAGAMATNDNSAQVTIAATGAVSHGVWCRGNSTFTSGYLWRNDGTSWNLFSNVGGSFTSIGSFAGAAVAGDAAKVQAVGSTVKGYVNGIERVSVVNTAVTTGTSVGIRAESTNLLRFDDFTGADVTSGVTGDAALSGSATLSATGLRAAIGDTALTSTAGLTADGTRATSAGAASTASATLTASGTLAASGDAPLTVTTALTASGQKATTGDAALTAVATLTAAGQRATTADAGVAAAVALGASGVRGTQADAGLAATASVASQGQIARSATAALAATAALTAAGTTALIGTAATTITATFTAGGTTTSNRNDVIITAGAPFSPWTAVQAPPRWTAVEAPGPWTVKEAP
jgi:hypothetical protein